jgi:hypothetical protein
MERQIMQPGDVKRRNRGVVIMNQVEEIYNDYGLVSSFLSFR